MRDDHNCIACPVEVRGLFAAASNALGAWERKDDPSRVARKMADLKEAIEMIAPFVDRHFEGMNVTGERNKSRDIMDGRGRVDIMRNPRSVK